MKRSLNKSARPNIRLQPTALGVVASCGHSGAAAEAASLGRYRLQQMRKRLLLELGAFAIVGGALVFVRLGYRYSWTGFGASQSVVGFAPAKTLWDWLDLLLVPLLLAVAAKWLENSRKKSELAVEEDRQRQKTLDDYLKAMMDMLVADMLSSTAPDSARRIARTRTLTALRALDGARKAQLLQFLYEAALVDRDPIVVLTGADFTGADLDGAVLPDAEMRGVHFERASLRNAILRGADLRGSNFIGADLSGAQLDGANLIQANLSEATVDGGALSMAIRE